MQNSLPSATPVPIESWGDSDFKVTLLGTGTPRPNADRLGPSAFVEAGALIYAGEPARAIEVLEANIRLDPFPWPHAFASMGLANYMLKRYGEAVRWCGEHASRLPNLQTPHLYLAAAHAQSGQLEEAKAEAAQVLTLVSQLKDTNVFGSTRTPGTSSTVLTGCARPDCWRVEPSRPAVRRTIP